MGPGFCSSLFVSKPTEEGRSLGISDMPCAGPVTVKTCVATFAAVTV